MIFARSCGSSRSECTSYARGSWLALDVHIKYLYVRSAQSPPTEHCLLSREFVLSRSENSHHESDVGGGLQHGGPCGLRPGAGDAQMRGRSWKRRGRCHLNGQRGSRTDDVLPQTDCLTEGLEDSKCEATDFECICADETLMASVEECALGTCTVIEGLGAS